jgi:hypothetical protein
MRVGHLLEKFPETQRDELDFLNPQIPKFILKKRKMAKWVKNLSNI